MKLSDRVCVPPHVLARIVEDELVLLNLSTGTYFGLDSIGARIWKILEEGKSIDEVCAQLMEDFEVARNEVELDTLQLAEELMLQGLIEIKND